MICGTFIPVICVRRVGADLPEPPVEAGRPQNGIIKFKERIYLDIETMVGNSIFSNIIIPLMHLFPVRRDCWFLAFFHAVPEVWVWAAQLQPAQK